MASFLLRDVRLVLPGEAVVGGAVLVQDGKIAAVGAAPEAPRAGTEVIEGRGRLLTPGLVDLHTHGVGRAIYESGPDALRAGSRELGRFGVTTVFPTIIPWMQSGWQELFRSLTEALPGVSGAAMPGLHLEGPFMAIAGAACPTLPGDVGLLDEILAACGGRVAIMSVSPDTPNVVPVIRRLREHGITVFLTHTRATVEQTEAALAAGASHGTHFYDVFPLPVETEPGVRPAGAVETILAHGSATVDFIADGVHVHPMAIRAAVAAKGWRGVCLITDSNIGAGLPPGVYDTPWGFPVRVKEGDGARHAEKGTLAGSALTMNRGMRHLRQWLKLPEEQVWAMGSANPARVAGLERKGRIARGADADLVLWHEDLTPARTWREGICIYEETSP